MSSWPQDPLPWREWLSVTPVPPHWRHLASGARVSRSNVGCLEGYSAFPAHPHVLETAAETPELGWRVGGPYSWVSCSEQHGATGTAALPQPWPPGLPRRPPSLCCHHGALPSSLWCDLPFLPCLSGETGPLKSPHSFPFPGTTVNS